MLIEPFANPRRQCFKSTVFRNREGIFTKLPLSTLPPQRAIFLRAWLYDVNLSGMYRERDSDSTDRLANAEAVLRQEPDEEEDEAGEEDDRKEDDDEGDGYSE